MMSASVGLRKRKAIPAWTMAAGIAFLLVAIVGYAKVTGQRNTKPPEGRIFGAGAKRERTGTALSRPAINRCHDRCRGG
jgi:hypothetical protein